MGNGGAARNIIEAPLFYRMQKAYQVQMSEPDTLFMIRVGASTIRVPYIHSSLLTEGTREKANAGWRGLTNDIFLFPCEVGAEVVHHDDGAAGHGFFCEETDVRGEDGVWRREKRIVFSERGFAVVDIDAGTCDFSFLEEVSESGIVDDAAAGGIDEAS